MKVTTALTSMRITRRASITDDQPVIHMAYSQPPKLVVVDHIEIDYTWKDGAWTVDSDFDVDITGIVLKKDGTPSKNRHTRHMPLTGRYSDEEPWPWLDALIELLRPHGDLSMTVLRDHEVEV